MVEIIAGDKGKGKTKYLITKANDSALLSNGSIVFLDKNYKHVYELSNRIRMICMPEFHIDDFSMFCGFLYGIVSQNQDLEWLFLDSFLTIAHVEPDELERAVVFLRNFAEARNINIVLSIAVGQDKLPKALQPYVSISL